MSENSAQNKPIIFVDCNGTLEGYADTKNKKPVELLNAFAEAHGAEIVLATTAYGHDLERKYVEMFSGIKDSNVRKESHIVPGLSADDKAQPILDYIRDNNVQRAIFIDDKGFDLGFQVQVDNPDLGISELDIAAMEEMLNSPASYVCADSMNGASLPGVYQ